MQGRTILLLCNNPTAVAYLRKEGGTRSRSLCLLSWEILNLCQVWGTHLQVHHITSRFNVLADSLSRFKPLSTEWQLDPTLFSHLRHLLPTLSIDLFGTCRNTQLPRFPSPFPDESAVLVEALSHPWDFPGVMYAFPPLLTAVLGRI